MCMSALKVSLNYLGGIHEAGAWYVGLALSECMVTVQSYYCLILQHRIVQSFEAVAVGLVKGENFTQQTIVEDGLAFSAVKVNVHTAA